jgi:hypothetical protein
MSPLAVLSLLACALLAPAGPLAAATAPAHGNPFFDPATITGASIDESQIRATITVDPAAPAGTPDTFTTLSAGFAEAHRLVAAGTPTRLRIAAGNYAESITGLNWRGGSARDTLLVVEGAAPGAVRWTGADRIPDSAWEDLGGGLFRARGVATFGHFSPHWGTPGLIGHRAEMLWIDGAPLRPVILEEHTIAGMGDWKANQVTYTFTGLLDPAATLRPGEFGVVESPERGGPALYIRLKPGASPLGRRVETTARAVLLDLAGKHQLVLRNLAFEKVANNLRPVASLRRGGAVFLGQGAQNILLEDVSIRWTSAVGLDLSGRDWTIRRSAFDFNGMSGLDGNRIENLVLEDSSTHANGWRALLGGRNSWFVGGAKMHEARRHLVRGHRAFANVVPGFWYDIDCGFVHMEDCVMWGNTRSLFWELSREPFFARRMVLAAARTARPARADAVAAAFHVLNTGDTLLRDSILWSDEARALAAAHWYVRDDAHARRTKPEPGVQRIENTLLVAGPRTDFLLMENNGICLPGGDRAHPLYPKFSYVGKNNVFFHPARAEPFHFVEKSWARRETDLAAWAASGRESGARWLDPRLRDPAVGDFRLAPDSPLAARAAEWPSIALDPAELAALRRFLVWTGWDTAASTADFVEP